MSKFFFFIYVDRADQSHPAIKLVNLKKKKRKYAKHRELKKKIRNKIKRVKSAKIILISTIRLAATKYILYAIHFIACSQTHEE